MSTVVLVAPLAGWSTPLEEAPDAVFAGRMLGDGLAIDPVGATVYAPCDGELVALPESRHAVTLRTPGGAEILIHVGIDTVGLGGAGFELHARLGQKVRSGERLLSFDLDLLARRARSVLTPVVVTEGFRIGRRSQDRELQVGDFFMELVPVEVATAVIVATQKSASRRVHITLEHGIHARPAAVLAGALRGFTANITLVAHGKEASARSTTALMTLGVKKGDEVELRAVGSDAEAALDAAEAKLCTEAATGVVASQGLALGRTLQLTRVEIDVAEEGVGATLETASLERALSAVRAHIELAIRAAPDAARDIMVAHLALLDDPDLIARAHTSIESGKSAGHAWRQAIRVAIESLRALGDTRMVERVDDLLDLESQVLAALQGGDPAGRARVLPPDTILIANELLPSQLVALDARCLAGICLAAGGATSHVAILAASLGIPVLVAMGPGVLAIRDGTRVVLDAGKGALNVDPDDEQLARATAELDQHRVLRAAQLAAAQHESRTADGTRIEIYANIGSVAEAELAVRNGAEGCGLLRTEFLFLERQLPPDEAEQLAEYQRIATALGGRPLTLRTLDIGGDKPIPYLPLPREDNPALGLRGVRTSLSRPDLLRTQLSAALAVQPKGQVRILLPMITEPAEIAAVRALLGAEVELGVMIETPAAAILADRIAAAADFFSIGTNDLTQYVLAMDRGHPELAARLDALHPAVLRLMARVAEAARAGGRRVAVCGGLASEPLAAPLLIGLGVHELSAVPAVIPQLKALIATLTVPDCRELARRALELESAAAVRRLVAEWRT